MLSGINTHECRCFKNRKHETMRKSLEDRFWSKVNKTDDCWEWTAYKLYNGYGRFSYNLKVDYAHRIAWLIEHGEYPTNQHVLHICDNPGCVRPDHLLLGTCNANMDDRNNKNRQYNRQKQQCRHGVDFVYVNKKRIAVDCEPCETNREYARRASPASKKHRADRQRLMKSRQTPSSTTE